MGLIATIVVGLVAGWLASLVMKTNTTIWMEMVLGIVGSIVGGWLASLLLGVDLITGVNVTTILVSLVGAILVIYIYRLIQRRR